MRRMLAIGVVNSILAIAAAEEPRNLSPVANQSAQQQQQEQQPTGQQHQQAAGQQQVTYGNSTNQNNDPKNQPTTQHQQLQQFVGTWTVTGTASHEPGGPAEPVNATVSCNLVMGNRFLRDDVRGNIGQKPFEATGFCGYDNEKGKFVSTMITNQCTSIKHDEGSYEPGTRTYTFESDEKGQDGANIKCKRVVRIVNDNEHTMTVFVTRDGREQRVKELTFKKAGGVAQAGQMNTNQQPGTVRAAGVDDQPNAQQSGNQSRGLQPQQSGQQNNPPQPDQQTNPPQPNEQRNDRDNSKPDDR